MPRPLSVRELEDLGLQRGEVVLGLAERNFLPLWIVLAVLGMGLMVLTVRDEVWGWGLFFLGIVAMALVGSMATSQRFVLTNRRFVRTGWRGRAEVALGKLERAPGAFGETLVAVGEDGGKLRVTNVKNAAQLVDARGLR